MPRRAWKTSPGLRRLRFSSFKFDLSKSKPTTKHRPIALDRFSETTSFLPGGPAGNHMLSRERCPSRAAKHCVPRDKDRINTKLTALSTPTLRGRENIRYAVDINNFYFRSRALPWGVSQSYPQPAGGARRPPAHLHSLAAIRAPGLCGKYGIASCALEGRRYTRIPGLGPGSKGFDPGEGVMGRGRASS